MEDVSNGALLGRVRCELERLTPKQALAEQKNGVLLVDVRTAAHRVGGAGIPGAIVIDLTELPSHLDPTFADRISEANSWDSRYILFSQHGYSSSLAAWNLRQIGLHRVTDITGGFEAWAQAGLTTVHGPAAVRS